MQYVSARHFDSYVVYFLSNVTFYCVNDRIRAVVEHSQDENQLVNADMDGNYFPHLKHSDKLSFKRVFKSMPVTVSGCKPAMAMPFSSINGTETYTSQSVGSREIGCVCTDNCNRNSCQYKSQPTSRAPASVSQLVLRQQLQCMIYYIILIFIY